ncbi:MAG: YlmC/YmxH family sporulation protein [Eubacteriales bacterium]|nr:YlmC/YmxH family sporulation protein [Eubacteriales bacterium]
MARIADLQEKEVINIRDGIRLGFVSDVEIDTVNGCVLSIIVASSCKVFGIFGTEQEYIIPWCNIKKIGDDIILVDINTEAALSTS